MSLQKKNFPLFSRVKFIQCMELTDETGTILGRSYEGLTDCYIVLLDENRKTPNGYEHAALAITEACLEQMVDVEVSDVDIVLGVHHE